MHSNSKILASIRLAEKDSMHETWQYPGNSFFAWKTVASVAYKEGFVVTERPDFKEYMVGIAPANFHDWFVATPI